VEVGFEESLPKDSEPGSPQGTWECHHETSWKTVSKP
jgi:hypothetical protein